MTAGKDRPRGTGSVKLDEEDLARVDGGSAVNPPARQKVVTPGARGLLTTFGHCACEAAVQDTSRG